MTKSKYEYVRHEEVPRCLPNGQVVGIDKNIAPLIDLMWSLGLDTNFCCEGQAKYVDQTVWSARDYRAYIQMPRTPQTLSFICDLLENFYAFKAPKVSWDIIFNRTPGTNKNRICIRFPKDDIVKLIAFLQSKQDLLRGENANPS